MWRFWVALAAGISLFGQVDPPTRVGRINYIAGAVSMQPGAVDDWVSAQLNRPLSTGDNLWVEDGGRAELHIGSTAIRLSGGTGMSFLNLDDRSVQLRLTEGSLQVHVRNLDEDDSFEIDTPNLAFSLLRPGDYRVDVRPEGDVTIVMVRGGDGEVTGGGQAFTLHAREQARVSGGDRTTYDVGDLGPRDGWDNWCAQRQQREESAVSARYVSREVIGYEDLDQYGSWRPIEGYGTVWVPSGLQAGWAPYRYGHWVWMDPWGWTWVDDAPWGFAPFHYGRWIYATGTWGWVPGPVVRRPVYSPALVAWVGGSRWSVSVSVGGGRPVGWFPLGPGEAYVPAYRASPRYVNQVNVTNTTITNVNITNVNVTNIRYVNRNAPGGFTAVSQESMTRSRPVAASAVRLSQSEMQAAPVAAMAAVAPSRESVTGMARAGGRPPARVMERQVVARRTPPPAPVPFAAQQQALAGDPGRPLHSEAVERLRKPEMQVRPQVRQIAPMANQGGRDNRAPMPAVRQPDVRPQPGIGAVPQSAPDNRPQRGPMPDARPQPGIGAVPENRPQRPPQQEVAPTRPGVGAVPQSAPDNRPQRGPMPDARPQPGIGAMPENRPQRQPQQELAPTRPGVGAVPQPAPDNRQQRGPMPDARPQPGIGAMPENRQQRPPQQDVAPTRQGIGAVPQPAPENRPQRGPMPDARPQRPPQPELAPARPGIGAVPQPQTRKESRPDAPVKREVAPTQRPPHNAEKPKPEVQRKKEDPKTERKEQEKP